MPRSRNSNDSLLIVTPLRFMRRALRWAFYVLATAALIWLCGMIWFAATMPKTVADRAQKTDAIIVLTGGSGRLKTGITLLKQDLAPWLFLSGVNPRVRRQDIVRLAGLADNKLTKKIVLGYRAAHTRGNATEIADWVRQNNVRSVRLVTANYHIRRAMLELKHVLPGVKLVPNPVFPPGVSPDNWWRRGAAMAVVVREYNKYLAALLRLSLV